MRRYKNIFSNYDLVLDPYELKINLKKGTATCKLVLKDIREIHQTALEMYVFLIQYISYFQNRQNVPPANENTELIKVAMSCLRNNSNGLLQFKL